MREYGPVLYWWQARKLVVVPIVLGTRARRRCARHIIRIEIAKTAIAGHDMGRALLDGLVMAIPFDLAVADIDHRAPWRVPGQRVARRDADKQKRACAKNCTGYANHILTAAIPCSAACRLFRMMFSSA